MTKTYKIDSNLVKKELRRVMAMYKDETTELDGKTFWKMSNRFCRLVVPERSAEAVASVLRKMIQDGELDSVRYKESSLRGTWVRFRE